MLLMVPLRKYLNMSAVVCTWTLVMMFLCGTSHAFCNNVRPISCFPGPRYDSCRETIEDLKALLEIMQSFKPDSTYACPTCSSTLSEELIVKLVNALIFTATQNCGFNGKGHGGIPVINGGGVGGNTGVIGGVGNTVIGDVGDIVNGGGNNGGGNNGGGRNNGSAIHGGGDKPKGGGFGGKNNKNDPLVGVNLLNDKDTVGVDVAGKTILGVDVGPQSGRGNSGAEPAGILPAAGGQSSDESPLVGAKLLGKDNELLSASLGKTELIKVTLGPNDSNGGHTDGKSQDATPSVGTSAPATSSGGGVTTPVTGVVPNESSSPVNNGPVTTSTATNQVAGAPQGNHTTNTVINQPITSIATNAGGATTPGTGKTAPDNYVNSGNSSTDENSSTVVNIINPHKSSGVPSKSLG